MKKHIFTICLILISSAVFAQIPSIGIKGGLNVASMSNSISGSGGTYGSVTSFNAGVFVDLKFGNISLQPALNYTGKGGSNTQTFYITGASNTESGGEVQTTKVNVYYLQLPVNLVFHIPVVVGNIYFGAGPYAAKGISGTAKLSNSSYSNSEKVTFGSGPNDFTSMQYGADAIAGFKLNNGLLINVNYDFGISNDVPSSEGGDKSHSRVFGVSLGYVFL